MDLTFLFNDQLIPITLPLDSTASSVKQMLEPVLNIPSSKQILIFQTRTIENSASLTAAGVKSGDLIEIRISNSATTAVQPQSRPAGAPFDFSNLQIPGLSELFRSRPEILSNLIAQNPALANAARSGNSQLVQQLLLSILKNLEQNNRRQQAELSLLNSDPFDIEAQRRIEETIRQSNIEENMEAAFEHSPESFGHVHMLYIPMEVNGMKLAAFVDSGAQSTIMSKETAEKCGILRLLDTRFAGIAKGVGSAKILGRVHAVQIQIGKTFFICSFTILDQPDMEFLFGLDLLKRHEACIDLKENVLRIGGEAVKFMTDKEIRDRGLGQYVEKDEKKSESNNNNQNNQNNRIPQSSSSASSSSSSTSSSNSNNSSRGIPANSRLLVQPPAPAVQVLPPVVSQPPAPVSASARVPVQPSPAPAVASVPLASFPESKISTLTELGFTRDQSIDALRRFNGNEEMAASYLFQEQMQFGF